MRKQTVVQCIGVVFLFILLLLLPALAGSYTVTLRNAGFTPVEYTIDEGPVNTKTSSAVLAPGETGTMYVRTGQYLFYRYYGEESGWTSYAVTDYDGTELSWRFDYGSPAPKLVVDGAGGGTGKAGQDGKAPRALGNAEQRAKAAYEVFTRHGFRMIPLRAKSEKMQVRVRGSDPERWEQTQVWTLEGLGRDPGAGNASLSLLAWLFETDDFAWAYADGVVHDKAEAVDVGADGEAYTRLESRTTDAIVDGSLRCGDMLVRLRWQVESAAGQDLSDEAHTAPGRACLRELIKKLHTDLVGAGVCRKR